MVLCARKTYSGGSISPGRRSADLSIELRPVSFTAFPWCRNPGGPKAKTPRHPSKRHRGEHFNSMNIQLSNSAVRSVCSVRIQTVFQTIKSGRPCHE